jgi:hypothetical protein
MNFNDVTVKGIFINQIVATTPEWQPSDIGRSIYVADIDTYLVGGVTGWNEGGGGGGSGTSGTSGTSGAKGDKGDKGDKGEDGLSMKWFGLWTI